MSSDRTSPRPSWVAHLRLAGLVVALCCAAAIFLKVMGSHVPIGTWLFWRYARVIAICAGWAFCCVSVGHRLLTFLLGRSLPLVEHATLSFALGVLAFFLLLFVGGLLALYGPVFAVALPIAIAVASGPAFIRFALRALRHLRWARRKPARRTTLWALPVATFGLMGTALLYFLILSPDNVGYDARWYHLALAEHYAAAGAIRPSPEGWLMAALPQLGTLLYSWTLQLPGLDFFDHVELTAHLEFTVFVFTLIGIPALVRAVVFRARAHWAWAALFLFPGIMLYDSSLIVGSDHIAAAWAVPIYLAARRALGKFDLRYVTLLAALMAGAALTKYQSLSIMAGPSIAFLARLGWLALRSARERLALGRRLWQAPLVALGVGGFLTAPHWLKNWFFYGDPVYPFAAGVFHPHPWTADTAQRFEATFGSREPFALTGTLPDKLREALLNGVLGFSFKVHDFPFHADIPVFGSLFTLLVLTLPFLRRPLRLAILYLCGHVAVFVWYWTVHEDRYLQPVVPWMAAAVAGTLVTIWRSGWIGQVACVPLVAAQIVWGGDTYFIPTHAMAGQSQVRAPLDLLSARYRKDPHPLSPYGVWADLRKALPRKAKVLVHQNHIHFGLGTMSVNDSEFLEGGIDYGQLGSSRAVYDLYKSYGVTHVLWFSTWHSEDSLAGDLVFWQLAKLFARSATPFAEGATLARMPEERPPAAESDLVIVRACGSAGVYADGTYHLSNLTLVDSYDQAHRPSPVKPFEIAAALQTLNRAEFVISRPGCDSTFAAAVSASFVAIGARVGGDLQYWSRRAP